MFEKYSDMVQQMDPIKYTGTVKQVKGLLIESHGPQVVVGESCQIVISGEDRTVGAEVIGFNGTSVQMMAFDQMEGIEPGCQVIAMGEALNVPVSDQLKGRVLNAMGKPIDGKGSIGSAVGASTNNTPPNVLFRKTIEDRMITGVRSIDAMTPVGKGQRIGIFSGSGVGKSTLLGMTARNTSADVNVIALIGERGREVREFIEQDLGEEGLKRSVLVVSTSDTSPLARVRGAFVATAIAEYFRDQGQDVMLLFDSITRFARAQREIGLTLGEPPATRGYTPSVFSILPKLLERCGNSEKGTITGFYTILVEGDDMDEPVSDTVRGILDGHIVLSRKLAQAYHYPAIDILASLSRLGRKVTGREEQDAAGRVRRLLATYTDSEDLINVGAYAEGSNSEIDEAIEKIGDIWDFLGQDIEEKAHLRDTVQRLAQISGVEVPLPEEADAEVSV
ncbi:MAG: FliI/YscN family ATPase [Spirochaetaceae bacterium]|nr:FliI/YscN family ATPase [Spirochaetaceae bacterium]MCF7947855.1 FliI/YscN family ATPase [Spirochaetia bacterium]MCF7951689.1 FliI/YscN family ATPase [Spirochaetaceae bacterium]